MGPTEITADSVITYGPNSERFVTPKALYPARQLNNAILDAQDASDQFGVEEETEQGFFATNPDGSKSALLKAAMTPQQIEAARARVQATKAARAQAQTPETPLSQEQAPTVDAFKRPGAPTQAGGPLGAVQQAMTGQASPSAATSKPSEFKTAFNEQKSAIEAQGKLAVAAEEQRAAVRQKAMEIEAKESAAMADKLERNRQAEDNLRQSMLDLNSKLANSNKDVNPNRFWMDKSNGQKAMAAIGIALGGFGASLTGGRNTAMDIINKAVDDDISAQKATIDNEQNSLRGQVALTNTLYGMARQRTGDDLQAIEIAKAARKEDLANQMENIVGKFQGEQQRAFGMEKIGALRAQAEEHRQQALTRQQEINIKREALDIERGQIMAKSGATSNEFVSPDADPRTLTPEQRERWVPGLGLALDKEAAKKARSAKADGDELITTLEKMLALRRRHGSEVLDRSAVKAGQVMARSAGLSIKKMETLGALDKGSVEYMSGLIPDDPLKFDITGSTEAQLQAMIDAARNSQLTSIKSSLNRPVESSSAFSSAQKN